MLISIVLFFISNSSCSLAVFLILFSLGLKSFLSHLVRSSAELVQRGELPTVREDKNELTTMTRARDSYWREASFHYFIFPMERHTGWWPSGLTQKWESSQSWGTPNTMHALAVSRTLGSKEEGEEEGQEKKGNWYWVRVEKSMFKFPTPIPIWKPQPKTAIQSPSNEGTGARIADQERAWLCKGTGILDCNFRDCDTLSEMGKEAFSHMAWWRFSLCNGLLLFLKDHT